MKRAALRATIGILSLLSLASVAPAFARTDVEISNNGEGSHTNVDVQTNTGSNTICQNGKCTTTNSGGGTSHVCINGQCYDSNSGDLRVQSDDGHAKVNINSNGSISVSPTVEPTETPEPSKVVKEKNVHIKVNPSITPSMTPEISKIIANHKKDIDKQKEQIEAHLARHQVLLQQFIDSMNNFFKRLHLF